LAHLIQWHILNCAWSWICHLSNCFSKSALIWTKKATLWRSFDFYSVFNTIQPEPLCDKFQKNTGECLHNLLDTFVVQTSSTIQSPVICRKTQVTQMQLWGESVDWKLSTGNWLTALHSVETIISSWMWPIERKKIVDFSVYVRFSYFHPKRIAGSSSVILCINAGCVNAPLHCCWGTVRSGPDFKTVCSCHKVICRLKFFNSHC